MVEKSLKALVVNRDELASDPTTGWSLADADSLDVLIKANPEMRADIDLHCSQTGLPIVFKSAHGRNGYPNGVRAHYAYAAGYAPERSHIFDEENKYTSIGDAIKSDAKILLNLNVDLSYRDIDLSQSKESQVQAAADWKYKNNYHSIAAKDLDSVVLAVRRVMQLGKNPNEEIFVSSRNAVLPFSDFYMGHKAQDFEKLYTDMAENKSGISFGPTRAIGFPRMFRFELAKTAIQDKANRGLRGNWMKFANDTHATLSHLILSEQDELAKQAQKRQIFNQATENGRGIYVLACPTISTGHEQDRDFLRMVRWVINDPERQIRNAPEKAPEEIINLKYKLA